MNQNSIESQQHLLIDKSINKLRRISNMLLVAIITIVFYTMNDLINYLN